jgi:hypothetical protein
MTSQDRLQRSVHRSLGKFEINLFYKIFKKNRFKKRNNRRLEYTCKYTSWCCLSPLNMHQHASTACTILFTSFILVLTHQNLNLCIRRLHLCCSSFPCTLHNCHIHQIQTDLLSEEKNPKKSIYSN